MNIGIELIVVSRNGALLIENSIGCELKKL